MRQTNRPRMRSKGNRRPNGNIINRVFESSGPEGKVRGNPQQIIDKYLALSRDAVLAGDRVLSENHAQHAEHYIRLLVEANREIEARRALQESQRMTKYKSLSSQKLHSSTEDPPDTTESPNSI